MKEQLLISKQRAQHPITYKKGVELAKRSSAHKYVDPHPRSVQQDLKVLEAIFSEIIKVLFESLTLKDLSSQLLLEEESLTIDQPDLRLCTHLLDK